MHAFLHVLLISFGIALLFRHGIAALIDYVGETYISEGFQDINGFHYGKAPLGHEDWKEES